MNRRNVLLVLVAITLVCASVVGTMVVALGGVGKDKDKERAGPAQRDAQEVAVALGKLPTDPDSLVATMARAHVAGDARTAVPPGSTVKADPSSWTPDGVGGGTILVVLAAPGRTPVEYAATMIHEGTGWKVMGTIPITLTATGNGPTASTPSTGGTR